MTTTEQKLTGHFIGDQQHTPAGEDIIDVFSPLDGSLLGAVPAASRQTTDQAVAVAQHAFERWSVTPIKERVQVLFRFKHLLEKNIDELSNLIHRENGKTISEGRAEIEKGIEVLEFASSLPQLFEQEKLEVSSGVDCEYKRYPLGVVLSITPFNFPAMVPMWTIPIAIGCGNTFLLKPSEQVPLTSVRLGELFSKAGLPTGVYNVLHGRQQTSEMLIDHPGIRAISFVGSTAAAQSVYRRAAALGKRVLALGGAKNHLVVVPDADREITAKNVVASAMGCAGQRCMAASVLILVGDTGDMLDRIINEAKNIKVGSDLGAIISDRAKQRIEGYITRAAQRGHAVPVDGRNTTVVGKENGWYVGPTIIAGVTPSDECACDEIFGPVLSVINVSTLEEALTIENNNPYGNAASIYTTSGAVARHFSEHANAGMVGVNIGVPVPREPFSFGGWNQSRFGAGDITGMDGIRFWTKLKKITTKWSATASKNWMS
ncbi:MAG: CoA-acylating methylmalonate-semialdehyde dehydrogenase [Cyclobacteriaceae bacterium]|nr:CoA-acylating methylmalonate-semialdehyde dehydrogenase [Cyclobacteriaceae bacterium]MDH4295666.1 CoA-acylating methylmalonate-semialdehyde dehydrogenase [Cyclobacteriaceae bacterium]MDH5249978.1 CoA-acylating methylmalonate-semialdehyde dehydrogenase [Cyclobacteriaceae bacterium]